MKDWASGAVLRGVTVTGSGVGVWVTGVDVTLERVAIQGCKDGGIGVGIDGALTLRDSLVARNQAVGIIAESSRITVERSVVRDTLERASDKQFGTGIHLTPLQGKSQIAELVLRDSLVAGNRYMGITVASSKATLERSVVRDTRERVSDKKFGTGIQAAVQDGYTLGSELVLRDSLVAGNRYMGITVASSKATLERSVVRDTREGAAKGEFGIGVQGIVQPGLGRGSELGLRDSLVARNRHLGVGLFSSKATVERCAVRDTREQASDKHSGMGFHVSVQSQSGETRGSELVLRDSLVANNRSVGINVRKSKAMVERCEVRDTHKDGTDEYGDGLSAAYKATLEVQNTAVEGNGRAGIFFWDAIGSVKRCLYGDYYDLC